jgi:hypothetical protein
MPQVISKLFLVEHFFDLSNRKSLKNSSIIFVSLDAHHIMVDTCPTSAMLGFRVVACATTISLVKFGRDKSLVLIVFF